jgi:hypothetical protein
MGGFQVWRDFLLALLGDCFEAEWESGRVVDIAMVDLMQYLAGSMQTKDKFDGLEITRRIEGKVAFHLNANDDPSRPAPNLLVVMLDTIHNVPKNKAGKQRSRDGGGSTEGAQGADGTEEVPTEVHMNQTMFESIRALAPKNGHAPDTQMFIVDNTQDFLYPLERKMIWRSVNLKIQLYRLITCQLTHTPMKKGRSMVIDDGMVFSTQEYEEVRKEVIRDYDYETESAFKQDCMINQLIIHTKGFIKRFRVKEGGVTEEPSTGVGEADIKVQTYITRESGKKRFLVINQDSDLIFILLLHMSSLLVGDETDDEYEVWLDTRSPVDDYKNTYRAYRYINIKKLYYALIKLFKKEYPDIKDPIATFCFIAFTLETDFTRAFPKCLGISTKVVWDVFSELSTPPHINEGGFLSLSTPKTKQYNKKRIFSAKLYGLLNQSITYDREKRTYVLEHESIKKFYFLLCQVRLLEIRRDLRLGNGFYDVTSRNNAIEPDELLIYARDVCERVQCYREYCKETKDQKDQKPMDAFLELVKKKKELKAEETGIEEKRYKLSSSLAKKEVVVDVPSPSTYKPVWIKRKVKEEVEEVVEVEVEEGGDMEIDFGMMGEQVKQNRKQESMKLDMKTYVIQNTDKLRKYAENMPEGEYFGVPSVNDMMARIYQREWYLFYCTNGYRKNGTSALRYTECAPQDKSLSLWGWKEEDVVGEDRLNQVLNSTYYSTYYSPNKEKQQIFRFTETKETNNVYHRRPFSELK